MEVTIRAYAPEDLAAANAIWNTVVEDGLAFPQLEHLDEQTGAELFGSQSFTGIAVDAAGEPVGLYILHPNNVGRCGHICNASYAVRKDMRGQGVGEQLVRHCIDKSRELGFRIMQFNAVVRSNHAAMHLYQKLGFVQLGVIPKGFLLKDGTYEDIVPQYLVL